MTPGCFLQFLLLQLQGQRLLGGMGDGCWVGGLGGDLGKYYMNGAVCLRLCGVHLDVVHSNKNALFGLHGVSVNVSE